MKLIDILNEVLNTYQVEALITSKLDASITHILDEIRALKKVTIVNNITPDDYYNGNDKEYTIVSIKFISRNDPKEDLMEFKNDILNSDIKSKEMRIEGIINIEFNLKTLHRL